MKRQITLALKGIAAAAVIYTGLSFASSASAMTLENSLQLDDDLVADSLGAITAFNTYCPHYELYSPTLSKSQVDLFIQAIDEAVDVNEKLLAAHRGGITKVLIPEENEKDLPEIPDNVKEGLTIIPVSHVSEVLKHALVSEPEAIEWDQEAEDAAAAAALARKSDHGDGATAH